MQHNLQRILDIIMDGLLSIASTNTSLKENVENDGSKLNSNQKRSCGDSGVSMVLNVLECSTMFAMFCSIRKCMKFLHEWLLPA